MYNIFIIRMDKIRCCLFMILQLLFSWVFNWLGIISCTLFFQRSCYITRFAIIYRFLVSKNSFSVDSFTMLSPRKSKTFLKADIIETNCFPFLACAAEDCRLNSFMSGSLLLCTNLLKTKFEFLVRFN